MTTRKLPVAPRFSPPPADSRENEYLTRLHRELSLWARDVASQVNRLSESQIGAHFNSLSATPALTIIRQVGDIFRDNSPAEAGTAGAKYVRLGWMQVTDGTASAAAVLELRALTGN